MYVVWANGEKIMESGNSNRMSGLKDGREQDIYIQARDINIGYQSPISKIMLLIMNR